MALSAYKQLISVLHYTIRRALTSESGPAKGQNGDVLSTNFGGVRCGTGVALKLDCHRDHGLGYAGTHSSRDADPRGRSEGDGVHGPVTRVPWRAGVRLRYKRAGITPIKAVSGYTSLRSSVVLRALGPAIRCVAEISSRPTTFQLLKLCIIAMLPLPALPTKGTT